MFELVSCLEVRYLIMELFLFKNRDNQIYPMETGWPWDKEIESN